MKVVVFGGSGKFTTGSLFVRQALEAGHTVSVLVRSRQRFVVPEHINLTVIVGDATNHADVEKVLESETEIVVTAIGSDTYRFSDVTTDIILASVKSKCPRARFLCVSSQGVGDSIRNYSSFYAFLCHILLWRVLVDKETQEQIIFMATGWLDWIIVRPGGLDNGPVTGTYKVGRYLKGGMISRADVAHFLGKCLVGDEFKHQALMLNR